MGRPWGQNLWEIINVRRNPLLFGTRVDLVCLILETVAFEDQFEKTEIPSADSVVVVLMACVLCSSWCADIQVQHALRARCCAEAWRTQRQR